MKCPKCGKRMVVIDSRDQADGVMRMRVCKCGTKFKTYELIPTELLQQIKEEMKKTNA